MVYYGRLSEGCERCRQRKIKCDQRRPSCARCLKSSLQCPGYRDIKDLSFRDESERIIGKTRKSIRLQQARANEPFVSQVRNSIVAKCHTHDGILSLNVPPVDDIGAHFFFSMFVADDVPAAASFRDWLIQSYLDDGECGALKLIIEAVGLSAIANTYYAPHAESRAERWCDKATKSLRRLLSNPYSACQDSTLMTVILLGQYETVNFQVWTRRDKWLAHVQAITTLLEIRGAKQFEKELGAQIYVNARSSIISACAQQQVIVPLPLVRLTHAFQLSEVRSQWRRHHIATPGSISELSFRIVNLLATCNNRTTDANTIRERALDIDSDLELWQQGLPPYLKCDTVIPSVDYNTKELEISSSKQPNAHILEAWNHWRTQRILANKIIIHSSSPLDEHTTRARKVIQQMCHDLCSSAVNMTPGPRTMPLIEPLYLVAIEDLVSQATRVIALEQLQAIGRAMGVRQAVLLADAGSRYLAGALVQVKPPCLQFEYSRSESYASWN